MITDKVEFEKIISEKGVPFLILMGDDTNFAFLKWQGSNYLLEIDKKLLVNSSLSYFSKQKVKYKNIYYKLYIHSLNTP